jgi:NAD(P)-dependent dehydrogenase (short-subunit alcohol dehydrogenase family)
MLVFGASGAVGAAVCDRALVSRWEVIGVSRKEQPQSATRAFSWAAYDPMHQPKLPSSIASSGAFDAVCWAQGANLSDSVQRFDADAHLDLYAANCLYVLKSLNQLLAAGLLASGGARLCVVSSIWQDRAKQDKLSYVMTKAALGGLVRSAAVDLAPQGHLVNAVLPGVLDTPMTAANLSSAQLERVKSATPFEALPTSESVADLILFLCSSANRSVTGQSVAVDYGFTNVRIL